MIKENKSFSGALEKKTWVKPKLNVSKTGPGAGKDGSRANEQNKNKGPSS